MNCLCVAQVMNKQVVDKGKSLISQIYQPQRKKFDTQSTRMKINAGFTLGLDLRCFFGTPCTAGRL